MDQETNFVATDALALRKAFIPAPEDPAEWAEWRRKLQQWADSERSQLGAVLYDPEAQAWGSRAYAQTEEAFVDLVRECELDGVYLDCSAGPEDHFREALAVQAGPDKAFCSEASARREPRFGHEVGSRLQFTEATRAAGCRGTGEAVSAEEDPRELRAGPGNRRPKPPRGSATRGATRAAGCRGTGEAVSAEEDPRELRAGIGNHRSERF